MRFPQMFMQGGFWLPAGGGGADTSGGVSALGPHFGTYMQQAGGQHLVLANGNYDGANMPADLTLLNKTFDNTKTYNGWLILEAQTPGGVTVDLSDPMSGSWTGGLNLVYTGGSTHTKVTPRILCIGINFKNGTIRPEWMQYLAFYYCDFTWPVSTFQTYYNTMYQNAHGGATPAIGSTFDNSVFYGGTGFNYHPTTVGIDQCSDIEFHYCDFHNIGDDAIYATSTNNLKLVGCRFWDIYHHGVNYSRVGGGVLMHSDCAQLNGGVTNFDAQNCSFGGHLDIETPGSSTTININNFWSYGSDHFGITLADDYDGVSPYTLRHTVSGNIKGGTWFCHFQYHGPDDYQDSPNYNTARDGTYVLTDPVLGNITLGFNDRLAYGFTTTGPFGTVNGIPGVHFLDAGNTDIGLVAANTAWHAYPAGVTQPLPAGIMAPDLTAYPGAPYPNTPTAYNNAANPAVIDRAVAGHGPANWLAYFTGRGLFV